MKMKIERNRIIILPFDSMDESYIEEVLGLKKQGDTCICKRENAVRMNELAYIIIERSNGKPKK